MGYSIGTGEGGRDIGYGVIATCDQPGCDKKIDRGMAYLCGEYRNDNACGLYFCYSHLVFGMTTQLCDVCLFNEELGDDPKYEDMKKPHEPKPDHPDWVYWKLNHDSWRKWRQDNPETVEAMDKRLVDMKYQPGKELQEMLEEE